MDQQPNIPKINPEVNREEPKRGGWAGLLSRLGAGSQGAGGLGGAGLSGGILATKAGIIGLIVVGTTVAGSIGMVGYKLFGPGASDRIGVSYDSLFAPKPKEAAGPAPAQGAGAQAAGGVSPSLDYLVKANSNKDAAQPEQPAASNQAASAASASAPQLKNDNAPGQGPAAKLKSDRKFGDFSKGVASGSGGGSSASGASASGLGNMLAGAKAGKLGAMSGPAAASRTGTGGMMALRSAVRKAGAARQLGMVYHDQTGARSSQAAGAHYDGNGQAPGTIGDAPGLISADGSGAGQQGGTDKNPSVPTASGGQARFAPIPAVTGANVTPWQHAINEAAIYAGLACALLFACANLKKLGVAASYAKIVVALLALVAMTCGIMMLNLGSQISTGQYAQHLQGNMLIIGGSFIMAAAGAAIAGTLIKGGMTDGVFSGGINAVMMVCGAAGLIATAVGYLNKPTSYDPGTFPDGKAPDTHLIFQAGIQGMPSQRVLERYLVS